MRKLLRGYNAEAFKWKYINVPKMQRSDQADPAKSFSVRNAPYKNPTL